MLVAILATLNFYPRPPRGGRPSYAVIRPRCLLRISIHALREEGDDGRR